MGGSIVSTYHQKKHFTFKTIIYIIIKWISMEYKEKQEMMIDNSSRNKTHGTMLTGGVIYLS